MTTTWLGRWEQLASKESIKQYSLGVVVRFEGMAKELNDDVEAINAYMSSLKSDKFNLGAFVESGRMS